MINISKDKIEFAMKTCPTRNDLAKYFNVSLSTIKRFLKKYNLSTFHKKFNELKFIELYNLGWTDAKIAKTLQVSCATITNYRNSLNLNKNFKYNNEILEKQILDLSELTNLEISKKLNIDVRVVEYFKNKPITNNDYKLSNLEKQIIIGSLLGDGNISLNKSKHLAHFIFAHSSKQKEYAIWKATILKNIMYYYSCFNEIKSFDKRTNKTYFSYRCLSKELVELKDYYYNWYKLINGKMIKRINYSDLMNLNSIGLAVWFMDDGFLHKNNYYISTNCFSKIDQKYIKWYFINKWNIYVKFNKNGVLYIPTKYSDIFTKIVKPFIHKDCLYKLKAPGSF